MKKIWIMAPMIAAIVFAVSCGGGTDKPAETTPPANSTTTTTTTTTTATTPTADPNSKGVGKYTDVQLTNPLDEKMLASGQNAYDVKCASCHKLTDEKLVGPGWKDVTKRRTPEWIMNFSTNTEEMLDKDPAALSLLEICLVRMPNQNLSEEEARGLLEFMRKNDGEK